MTKQKTILRWLRLAAVLQGSLLFIVEVVSTRRLRVIATSLRDSLYESGVPAEQVREITEAFASISNDLVWVFLAGMVLTGVGYGLLASIVKKNWPKPMQRADCEDAENGGATDRS